MPSWDSFRKKIFSPWQGSRAQNRIIILHSVVVVTPLSASTVKMEKTSTMVWLCSKGWSCNTVLTSEMKGYIFWNFFFPPIQVAKVPGHPHPGSSFSLECGCNVWRRNSGLLSVKGRTWWQKATFWRWNKKLRVWVSGHDDVTKRVNQHYQLPASGLFTLGERNSSLYV